MSGMGQKMVPSAAFEEMTAFLSQKLAKDAAATMNSDHF